MPVAFVNLQIDQFADFSRQFTWVLSGPPITPVDLSGVAARMKVRQFTTDVTPLLSITNVLNGQGQILLGGSAGTMVINILKSATSALIPATGPLPNYDLFIDWPNGTSTEVLKGQVLALPSNTY